MSKQSILVVNGTPQLVEMTRQTVPPGIVVDEASGLAEVLQKIQRNRPALIILKKIEPESAQRELLDEIRQGWITRHSLLLVVEVGPQGDNYRILDESPALESSFTSGEPLVPQAAFLPRLNENILLKARGCRQCSKGFDS